MSLTTRTTKFPNGVEVTETFEGGYSEALPYEQYSVKAEEVTPADTEPDTEPYTVTFRYHGSERTVQNPQIVRGAYQWVNNRYNPLLGGVEVESGQYKNFRLSEIEV